MDAIEDKFCNLELGALSGNLFYFLYLSGFLGSSFYFELVVYCIIYVFIFSCMFILAVFVVSFRLQELEMGYGIAEIETKFLIDYNHGEFNMVDA